MTYNKPNNEEKYNSLYAVPGKYIVTESKRLKIAISCAIGNATYTNNILPPLSVCQVDALAEVATKAVLEECLQITLKEKG